MKTDSPIENPWYREPWPWILMSGPVAVLIAGVATTWIAFATSDGLVAQDYYKQGLAVNRVLEREANAARLGISARVEFAAGRHRVAVSLAGVQPAELRLQLAHATRSGHDLALRLVRTSDGRFEAAVPAGLPAGHWSARIEQAGGDWRLAGEWNGRDDAFVLGVAAD